MINNKSSVFFLVVTAIAVISIVLLTYLRNGFWLNSITLWDDVIAKTPHKGRIYLEFAGAWQKAGNKKMAESILMAAQKNVPDFPAAYFELGNIRYADARYVEAAAYYVKALEKNPRYTGALLRLAMIDLIGGKLQDALDKTGMVLKIDESYADAYMVRGIIFSKMNDPQEAVVLLEKALSLAPEHQLILLNLGILRFGEGRYVEAAGYFKKAAIPYGYAPEANLWLGRALFMEKKYNEAVEAFESYLALRPSDSAVRSELALVYERSGLKKAEKH